MEFMKEYPNDETCLTSLWRKRYAADGTNAHCPKCQQTRAFSRYDTTAKRPCWTCTACGYHVHPTAGTIFHKSSTSLHLWFYAMYLMTSTRCGISAKQLERELGVTYKTAWRMAYLIRTKLMAQDGDPIEAGSKVEMDETYVGGRRRWSPVGRPSAESHKAAVQGIVARGGKVVALSVPSVKGATLLDNFMERVLPRSIIFTDEFRQYDAIGGMNGFVHYRIRHSARVYVNGDVHTNTIEGFWSLVKRGLSGVYHSVSKKHLQGYLNEYAWRYNQRFEARDRFELLLLRAAL